jgi:hypothetical protein
LLETKAKSIDAETLKGMFASEFLSREGKSPRNSLVTVLERGLAHEDGKSQLRALSVSKVWQVLAQSQFLKVELAFDDMQNLVPDEHPVPHVYYAVSFGEQRSQAQLAQLSICPVVARRGQFVS